jgi:hypothetical protein
VEVFMEFTELANTLLMVELKPRTAPTVARAIRVSRSAYSVKSCPLSSSQSLLINLFIAFLRTCLSLKIDRYEPG